MPPGTRNPLDEISGDIYSLGLSLLESGRVREAAFQFRKGLLLNSDNLDAMVALAHCLHLSGDFSGALALYDQALLTAPEHPVVWNNRGNALLELCRYQEAIRSYSSAVALAPDLLDARVAMATCLQALGRFDEAMALCNDVVAVAPDNAEAHWNRGLLLLLHGEYSKGWREYEWRWRKRGFTSPRRNFPHPHWQGEPVFGKTILIHAEQGFGDTIQFCRYLPMVAARCSGVIFECHPPLVPLMKALGGNLHVTGMGETLPHFDLHLPLLTLPFVFGTTLESIPNNVPYLAAASSGKNAQSQILDCSGLKVGICWAGKTYPDPGRSCPLENLTQLADIKGLSWHSLQVGWNGELPFPMTDLTGGIAHFADTAAIVAQLDLIITIDTAVAHLAGALGKQTWVMLPYSPDWRWMLDRDDSPWYPTMRLFRQHAPGGWEQVVKRIAELLKTEVENK